MNNLGVAVLPAPIVYATAFSIIIIATAILIWLIITIIFGTLLLKKMNILTKKVTQLTETWNEKSKQIADQTTATIQSFQVKPKTENNGDKKASMSSIITGLVGIGSVAFEVIKLINKNRSRKEK